MRRAAQIAVPCLLTVGLAVGWAWYHRRWLQEPIVEHGVIEAPYLEALRAWRATAPGIPRAALLGNSLTDCKDGILVGDLTARALAARNAPYALFGTYGAAFGPLQYYYVLDEVLAGHPRVVIVEIDMNRLVEKGFFVPLLYRTLSRKLSLNRALRVRAALDLEGLTLFDPFLYRLEERFDMMYVAPGLREHWRALLARWGTAVNDAAHLRTTEVDLRAIRGLGMITHDQIAQDPTASPLVPVLRLIGEELRREGVAVLFYVSPINDMLLGPRVTAPERRVRERVDRIRREIGATPDEWVDLHDTLPSETFRDWIGHMFPAGCERVSASIVDAVLARHDAR